MTWTTAGPTAEEGSRTIIASTPYERVDVELDLGKQGAAQTAYLLRREGERTDLTWTFETDFGFNILGRYRGLLLDRQLGPTLAQGLINLKRIAEALPKVDWSDIEIGISVVPSKTIAYATGSCGNDPTEISAALAAAYGKVLGFVSTNGLQLAGQPLAITNYRDDRGFGFDAGIPVDGNPGRGAGPDSAVRMGETYGGRVVLAVHVGAYEHLQQTTDKVAAFAAAHDLHPNGRPWEVFVSDPGNVAEQDLVTEIYYPVK
jgi:effector-binding domain-containing protein